MSEQTSQYVNLECINDKFRPQQPHAVQWLDAEDFPLALDFWTFPISYHEWLNFQAEGYQYCAVVDEERILSMAAIWRYSDQAWELAAVSTRPEFRQQGYGQSVSSFVTASILAEGRLATCLTAADNIAMQNTAKSIGFYYAPRR